MFYRSDFPNRTYCDTLEEMRQILGTLTHYNTDIVKGVIASLIEECQVYGNRMESSLRDKKDIHILQKERSKVQKEVDALKIEKEELGGTTSDEF